MIFLFFYPGKTDYNTIFRAGADITQTFTFYSRDIGTPEDVNLTVSFFLDAKLFYK